MNASIIPALVVIPARGGSKGVKHKNLRRVGGVSLVAHAIRCAMSVGGVDRIVVTTDSQEIADESMREGGTVVYRPAELASDTANVVDAIDHVLSELGTEGYSPAVVLLLEPSCPLRTPGMVNLVLEALRKVDAAFTVSSVPLRFHPAKQFSLDLQGHALPACSGLTQPVRRQDLQGTFIRNGAVYGFRPEVLRTHRSVLGPSPRAILVKDDLVNIDTEEDLLEADRLYRMMGDTKRKSSSAQ